MATQLPLPHRGTASPNFRPMSVVAKRLDIKMPLGPEVGLDPGHIVLYRDTAPPPQRGTAPQLSIVTKRSPISATVEQLYHRFIDKSIGERIVKIGQHLAKLEAKLYLFTDRVVRK